MLVHDAMKKRDTEGLGEGTEAPGASGEIRSFREAGQYREYQGTKGHWPWWEGLGTPRTLLCPHGARCRAGFLNLDVPDIWGQVILCCE